MKIKILSLILTLALAFNLTACKNDNSSSSNINDSQTEQTSEPIGEDPIRQHGEFREITSMELVSEMGIGWNLGNTLDVCQADRDGDGNIDEHAEEGEKVDETLWGNPKATKELFETLKSDGIKSVRIPITWRDHLDEENNIDVQWMDRVQEVVDYAYDLGLYVIINIHHDGGDDEKFGAWVRNSIKDYDTFYARYSAIWEQVCERFKDYSDYLVFESMNEVGFDGYQKTKAFDMLNKINQDFVDIVRESGGNNAKRHLLIAGYWTDITETTSGNFELPKDTIENRQIVSVHYYTPWQFAITNIQNNWGTTAEVNEMKRLVGKLETTFIENDIPVIVGEYAASGNDLSSCIYFIEMFVKLCDDIGVATYYWDNGGQVNRHTYQWRTPQFLEAMKRGTSGEDYTPEKLES